MPISTNGTVLARVAGALYNTVLSNASYLEAVAADPATTANTWYKNDFASKTDLAVAQTLLSNLGLSSIAGLDNWVAAQLTAAGANNKGAKIASLLNDFAGMTADATYGTYAAAFNTKVDAALATSQKTGAVAGTFATATSVAPTSTSLTSVVESLVGGAGDDTFTAPATSATTGLAATTINSGDSIDGGAGTDTLNITVTASQNLSLSGLTVTNVENVVITGSDYLGNGANATAIVAAATAKDDAVAAYSLAQAKVLAAAQVKAAYTDIKAMTEAQMATAEAATTVPTGAIYTLSQYKAALSSVKTSTTGAALIGAADDTTNLRARATELETDANTNLTNATSAAGTASTAVITATVAYEAAIASAATASVAATLATASISVDGAATNVTSIGAQSVTLSGTSAANTLKYVGGTTSATVNLSNYSGTVTLDDNSSTTATTSLTTATVNGTVYRAAAASTSGHTIASPGTVVIKDDLGTSNGETVATLNLGITSAAVVDVSDLGSKLVTLDGSTSTGALTITTAADSVNKLTTVKTGSGADVLNLTFGTDVNGVNGPVAATADAGAGNDSITVTAVGTGTLSVAGGAGNDTFTIATSVLTPNVTLNGGDGTDKIKLTGTGATLNTQELILLSSQLSNFERIEVASATSLDASKVSQFTTIDLGANTATVTKLADAQVVNSALTSTLSSAGYIAKGSAAATAAGLTTTTYAGDLTVNLSGSGVTQTVNANSVAFNVNNISSTTALKVGDQTSSSVTLTGDFKTATVSLTSGNDYVTGPTSNDVISTVYITPVDSTAGVASAYTGLGNLTSVTLKGVGRVVIDNSDTVSVSGVSYADSKLATIDASALGGVKGALATTLAGNPLGGLTYTGNTLLAETVTLGSGQDLITVGSTYAAMDTITNFKLVGNTDLTLNTAKSDDIRVSGVTNFVKQTAGLTGSTIGAMLVSAASSTLGDSLVFQFGGDTYIYVDAGTAGSLDSSDTVVKLTGAVDLDLLVLALNSALTTV